MGSNNSTIHAVKEDIRHRTEELRHRAEEAIHEAPSAAELEALAEARAAAVLERAEEAPTSIYVATAAGSAAVAAVLFLMKRRVLAVVVGVWPLTVLGLARALRERRAVDMPGGMSPMSAEDGSLLAE